MFDLLQDTSFWTAVSFVFFIILVAWKGRQPIADAVYGRIERIRNEIEAAKKIRSDSEILLHRANEDLKLAVSDSENMISNALKEAEFIIKNTETRAADLMSRQKAQAQERMNQLREQANQSLKEQMVYLSVAGAHAGLQDRLLNRDQTSYGELGQQVVKQSLEQALSTIKTIH